MVRSARLPGSSTGPEQVVCHVDMDCFYAACERLREPKLRGEPVVVGMGFEPGETDGAVATASYEAREFGIESAQAISEALERLPRRGGDDAIDDGESDGRPDATGYYRPVDMDYYESIAASVKEILNERAAVVREVSIDEAYLDVGDRVSWDGDDPRRFARRLKTEIEETVGVTASVGVAPTMSCAKVASDHDKPDGLVVVEPGEVASFLAPLDVEAIHGVGPVTARALRDLGIETAGDLADADPGVIEDRFGERGLAVYRYARGEDDRAVEPIEEPKSLSRESSFSEATADVERSREQLRTLAAAVSDRASRKGALYRTIGIKVVTPPYDVNTRAETLPGPVADADLVEDVALSLFEEFEGEPVRKVGVRVANLEFSDEEQTDLGGWDGPEAAAGSSESRTARTQSGQVTLADAADGTARGSAEQGGEPDRGERRRPSAGSGGQRTLEEF